MNWSDIPFKKASGKEYTICPSCSHTRKKKTDKCLSIDHDTGHYNCSHCGIDGWREDKTKNEKVVEKEPNYVVPKLINNTDLPDNVLSWFKKRGLKSSTLIHFKVTAGLEWMPQAKKDVNTIQYNYFKDGVLTNVKYKTASKFFKMYKDAEKIPYNLDAIKDTDSLLFCEGEEEAMVWWQSGIKTAISVPNGATLGKNNLDYIRKYWDTHFDKKKRIYIAVDNDEPGEALKEDLIRLFGKNKCYIINYPKLPNGEFVDDNGNTVTKYTKDANDLLLVKGEEYLMDLYKKANGFPIEGIFNINCVEQDMWKQFRSTDLFNRGTSTYKKALDEHWTWRKQEMNILFGAGNQGKSAFFNELAVLKSIHDKTKWAIFSPEQNPPIDFYNDVIHTFIGKSTDPNFPHLQMSEDEFRKGLEFANEYFTYVYPKENHDKKTLTDIFSAVIIKEDIEGIVIDPFNQLDRVGEDAKLRDDQYISKFGSEFKRFITEHNVYSMIITHGDARFDQNSRIMLKPNMYRDIEGGKMWSKKADNILFYYRPQFELDIKDPLCIVGSQKIKKQKLVGKPGDVEYTFDRKINRFIDRSGYDDFSGKRIPDNDEKIMQLGFPKESYGTPNLDFDENIVAPF